jgi:hypothetical protein
MKHRSSSVFDWIAIPANLVVGILAGLVLPVAAIAAMIAGVRLFTGKFPFLSHALQGESGERELGLELVAPERVRELWAEHRSTLGEPLQKLAVEIQAMSGQVGSAGNPPS